MNWYDPYESPLTGLDAMAFDLALTLKAEEKAQEAQAGVSGTSRSAPVGSWGQGFTGGGPPMSPDAMAALKDADHPAWHRRMLQRRGAFNRT